MTRRSLIALALTLLAAAPVTAAAESSSGAGSLRGSLSSMERQHQVAEELDYTFLRTPQQVSEFVADGHLVEIVPNQNFELARVSFPYARPELGVFIERISKQYREGCGEPLVVTSLTRPTSLQPGNAHRLSVHPAGMAVDFRISQNAECRAWMEETLLSLERGGVLDITRERNPPHYHVAVFPEAYMARVSAILADSTSAAQARAAIARQSERTTAAAARREAGVADPVGPLVMAVLMALAFAYLLSTAPGRHRADA